MSQIFGNCTIGGVRHWEMASDETGGRYDIFVSLPPGFGQADRNYPLLIALDANYCIGTVAETAAIQALTKEAQPLIVVGVGSAGGLQAHFLRRLRDYTPGVLQRDYPVDSPVNQMLFKHIDAAGLKAEEATGHADEFLRFLENELLPRLRSEFPIDWDDVGIAGHSASGALVSHVLLTRARPFRKLILASFATLWYGAALADYEGAFAAEAGSCPLHVFSCFGGAELSDPALGIGLETGVALLERLAAVDRSMTLKLRVIEGETHGSVQAHVLSSGIRELWPGLSYSDGATTRAAA